MHHLVCSQCKTENTLDLIGCRACGQALDLKLRQELRDENDLLAKDGRKIFEASRIDEAKLIADSILQIQPDSALAWSLLGDCHEKEGAIYEALAAYEQVIAIDSHTKMDEVRYEYFKNLTEAETQALVAPKNRRVALFTIIAGALLLSSIGAALLISHKQNLMAMNTESKEDPVSAYSSFTVPLAPVPGDQQAQSQNQPQSTTEPVTQEKSGGLPPATGGSSGSTNRRPSSSRKYGDISGTDPFVPFVPGGISLEPAGGGNPENKEPAKEEESEPEPANSKPVEEVKTPPVKEEGVAKITVLNKHTGNGSEPVDESEAESWIRKARDFAARGQYSQAASAYEQALKQGASTASTNQRLAQCYERLGRRNDAINAYRRAIVAYDRMLAGDDSPRLRAARGDCEQAIKALGG